MGSPSSRVPPPFHGRNSDCVLQPGYISPNVEANPAPAQAKIPAWARGQRQAGAAPAKQTPPSLPCTAKSYVVSWSLEERRTHSLRQEFVPFGIKMKFVGGEQLRTRKPVRPQGNVISIKVAGFRGPRGELLHEVV